MLACTCSSTNQESPEACSNDHRLINPKASFLKIVSRSCLLLLMPWVAGSLRLFLTPGADLQNSSPSSGNRPSFSLLRSDALLAPSLSVRDPTTTLLDPFTGSWFLPRWSSAFVGRSSSSHFSFLRPGPSSSFVFASLFTLIIVPSSTRSRSPKRNLLRSLTAPSPCRTPVSQYQILSRFAQSWRSCISSVSNGAKIVLSVRVSFSRRRRLLHRRP